MKLLYTALSVTILLTACGPKTETKGGETTDTNKTQPAPADSDKTAVTTPIDTPKVETPATPNTDKTEPAKTGKDKVDPTKAPETQGRITINGKWTLSMLNSKTPNSKVFTKGNPTIDINTVDNRCSGFGGCNTYNGTFTLSQGKKIKIEKIISTKMFCEGIPENEFMTALRNATNLSVADGKLVLKDDSGKPLVAFVR